MTPEQAAYLRNAKNLAASRLGINAADTASLPYEKREAYVTELATIILTYPARFDSVTLANARRELADAPNKPLEEYKWGDALGDAADAVAETAANLNPVPQLAESIKTTLKLAPWVLAGGVLLWLFLSGKNSSIRINR